MAAASQRGGRKRGVDEEALGIVAGLRAGHLRQPARVEAAMGQQALGYARPLDAVAEKLSALEAALTEEFNDHPDAEIITSFPGLGVILGARLLGEIGDNRVRFASARGLKAFAGTAPITRASGPRTSVTVRTVRNKRLNHAAYLWALPLILHSAAARTHYDRRRTTGDSYSAAARNVVNRHLGMLHHCLQHRELYDSKKAYAPADTLSTAVAS